MDDFQNNGFGSGNQTESNGFSGGAYYTPPQSENNTTYHYSYTGAGSSQSGNQSTYQGSADAFDSGQPQPPKKNKNTVAKIIIVVLVICLMVATAGIVVSIKGYNGHKESGNKNETTTSQSEEDVKTSDSQAVPTVDKEGNYTVAGVAKECMDSCVGITVYSQQVSAYEYFYGYGQNNNSSNGPVVSGEGSGVIMSESNGKTYIITCAHVISNADEYKVTLNDGTECDAKLVGADAQTDIGVLSIEKTGLKVADFANSDQLVVGEQVVAIGCPGGLEFMNSVTSGYVSALARPISSSIGYDNKCIQTDTAINPGNSGGALFNMQGQVVGINSSKIASAEYEGMGFAVPTNTAIATANSLIKVGYVEGRAKLGITYSPITSFNNSKAVINALESQGFKDCQGAMVIDTVEETSDLASKDIKKYDMIVAVNGKTMTSTDVMISMLAESKPGDTVKLTIARIENNSIRTFEIECKLIESKG